MGAEEKDLHYFITRIINPDLNWIVVSLRSSRRVVYGRDGYTGLRWADHSISDELASRLEEWRDNLWYKYKQGFPGNGKAILDEFFEILVVVEAKLSEDPGKRPAVEGLWNLAERMGEYLGLSDYVSQKIEEVKKRAAEIRERDHYLRERVKEAQMGALEESQGKSSSVVITAPRYDSQKVGTHGYEYESGGGFPWKVVGAVVVVLLIFGGVWAYTKGELPILSEKSDHGVSDHNMPSATCISGPFTLKEALECYLNDPKEMNGLKNLALQLKGEDIKESAWNIVTWEDQHITYDEYTAEAMTHTVYRVRGPLEVIGWKRGICVEYTVLTVALLIDMNYSPVYVFDINFSNDPVGHTAAAIKVNGLYFIIDQHPPIMDLGTYWKDWAYWREESSNGKLRNLIISSATVYEIKRTPQGIIVTPVETLAAVDFKKYDYRFSQYSVSSIELSLRNEILRDYPNLQLDKQIADVDKSQYLPQGYEGGVVWKSSFPRFGEYYNPIFHEEFVKYLYDQLMEDKELRLNLEKYNRFWVNIRIGANNSLEIGIILANK